MKKVFYFLVCFLGACVLNETTDAPAPKADFQIASKDRAQRTIKIVNLSQYVVESQWDFGDGTKSTTFNPTHTYRLPGHYRIKLKVKGAKLKGTDEHTLEVSFLEIKLDKTSIQENQPKGTVLGALSTIPDGEKYTYSLVNIGNNDNNAFTIKDDQISTNQIFDFETQKEYVIYIRSESGAIQDQQQFSIKILDTTEPPIALSLSNNTIAENQVGNTIIGIFRAVDNDFANDLTYALVSGSGATDNSNFIITDSTLKAKVSLNFEAQAVHQIRVQVEDADKNKFQKAFTIRVGDVADNPTDILISKDSIAENEPVNTAVANFTTFGSNIRAKYTYTLLSGAADFNIKDNTLQTSQIFNYETENSYPIRVRVADQDGQRFEKNFTIHIKNLPEPSEPFRTKWKTTRPNESITIPTTGSGYKYTIDWGDGNVQRELTGTATHTYAVAGTYTVSLSGAFPRIFCNNPAPVAGANSTKIISIEQWGKIVWQSMFAAFQGAINLELKATDSPDLSKVTDLGFMFSGAKNFNANINGWDISNITNTANMFSGASAFNSFIGGWNVSKVVKMDSMFFEAVAFNVDLSAWNVSNVTSTSFMFAGDTLFNIDLRRWNVGNVTDMEAMFKDAKRFNGSVGGWDVSNVTSMRSMFSKAVAFDQDLGNWNIGNVRNMQDMFSGVTLSVASYDSTLNGWSRRPSQTGVNFNAGNSKYSNAGEVGRNILVGRSWTITDGGKTP